MADEPSSSVTFVGVPPFGAAAAVVANLAARFREGDGVHPGRLEGLLSRYDNLDPTEVSIVDAARLELARSLRELSLNHLPEATDHLRVALDLAARTQDPDVITASKYYSALCKYRSGEYSLALALTADFAPALSWTPHV